MASYGFMLPVLPGKEAVWKKRIAELNGPRRKDAIASRKRAGLTVERVWLQKWPMGQYAVVYWEAKDIAKASQSLLASKDPFDIWFLEKFLKEAHGLNPSRPVAPLNELVFGFKA